MMYSISGQVLNEVNCTKYLGVNISNDLDSSEDVSITAQKGNSASGFLHHNFACIIKTSVIVIVIAIVIVVVNLKGCPEKLKELNYMTLIRSVLEYRALIWGPHKVKDIDKLQCIQCQAAQFVCGDYHPTSSVTA